MQSNQKYKNKYRIKTTRLPDYDYGQNGGYFVTVCTKNRQNLFGKIVRGKMELSEIGQTAINCWGDILETG